MTHEYKDQPTVDLEGDRIPRMFRRRASDRSAPGLSGSTVFALILQGAAIIVTLFLTMRSGEMSILARLEEVKLVAIGADKHAQAAMKELEHHIEIDHEEKDKARLQLHNQCAGAQNRGCHPSVTMGRVLK